MSEPVPKIPFPLPDLPRRDQPSDLTLLIIRVLEYHDVEALARLPDKFYDCDRMADRAAVYRLVSEWAARKVDQKWKTTLRDESLYTKLLQRFFWDIFDWDATLAQLARKPLMSGTGGKLRVGEIQIPIGSWEVKSPLLFPDEADFLDDDFAPDSDPPDDNVDEAIQTARAQAFANGIVGQVVTAAQQRAEDVARHTTCSHPDFEYHFQPEGQPPPPSTPDGMWVHNNFVLVSPEPGTHWMRRRPKTS